MSDYALRIKEYLLQDIIAKEYGFTPELGVNFLAQGEYNKNYTVSEGNRRYVFRINTGSQLNLDNQIEYEYRAIKKLEKSGVTPTAHFYDDSRNFFEEGVLMMNFLEGRPLDYSCDLNTAAEIFSRIHSLDSSDFSDHLIEEKELCTARIMEADGWLEPFRQSNRPNGRTRRLMERLYAYCSNHAVRTDAFFRNDPWQVVNNTEVNSHNFIIGKDRSFLIDWEKPVISDPVQDITQFLAPTTTLWRTDTVLSKEQVSDFYRTYERHAGRGIEERVEAYKPFLFLRAFSWCAGAWISYTDETRAIRNESTLRVISKYLEPEFMEHILKDYMSK